MCDACCRALLLFTEEGNGPDPLQLFRSHPGVLNDFLHPSIGPKLLAFGAHQQVAGKLDWLLQLLLNDPSFFSCMAAAQS